MRIFIQDKVYTLLNPVDVVAYLKEQLQNVRFSDPRLPGDNILAAYLNERSVEYTFEVYTNGVYAHRTRDYLRLRIDTPLAIKRAFKKLKDLAITQDTTLGLGTWIIYLVKEASLQTDVFDEIREQGYNAFVAGEPAAPPEDFPNVYFERWLEGYEQARIQKAYREAQYGDVFKHMTPTELRQYQMEQA
jgi:hypothetical protein